MNARWTGAVRRKFRGFEDREETATDAETIPRDESRSSLFQCLDCGTVYVDTDKETCSACSTTVEQLPSTLTETV